MKVGCFAIIDAFLPLERQLARIANLGFKYGDVTDNHDGASLGREYGFVASASLDGNPYDLKRLFEKHGLEITSFCAHANLLDPSAPWNYSTNQIIKAVKMASDMKIRHVITSEGEPKTKFGHKLTEEEKLILIRDRLYEPLRLATDLNVKILIENHGMLTDTIDGMSKILDVCDYPEALGINLDTGNCWLGGEDPVKFAEVFADKIEHIHWKDLDSSMEAQRMKIFGCGMGTIPLGQGVINLESIINKLKHVEYSTLEVYGEENLKNSYEYLKNYGIE
jgi:inosose dehydratase